MVKYRRTDRKNVGDARSCTSIPQAARTSAGLLSASRTEARKVYCRGFLQLYSQGDCEAAEIVSAGDWDTATIVPDCDLLARLFGEQARNTHEDRKLVWIMFWKTRMVSYTLLFNVLRPYTHDCNVQLFILQRNKLHPMCIYPVYL